jgi:hypothetical protein
MQPKRSNERSKSQADACMSFRRIDQHRGKQNFMPCTMGSDPWPVPVILSISQALPLICMVTTAGPQEMLWPTMDLFSM